jgi:hypothetical protein
MFLFEHDLFGKLVPTFPDHALASSTRTAPAQPLHQATASSLIVRATGHNLSNAETPRGDARVMSAPRCRHACRRSIRRDAKWPAIDFVFPLR